MTLFPRTHNSPRLTAALCIALTLFGAGCKSAEEQAASADRAVYSILEARRAELGADMRPFTIEPPPNSLRQQILNDGVQLPTLSLVAALDIAAENSRDYQTQKESLYLTALDLTLERFAYQVQKSGEFAALLNGDGDGADQASTSGNFGLTKLLGTGAQIVGNIGLSLARTLSTADGWDAISNISLAVTQPLMRGYGERIVMEPLTQAERNVVYEVRSFERYRRTFAVQVANRFFRILQQRDALTNEENNFENLKILRVRNEELGRAGRMNQVEVDQALQDELSAKSSVITQRQRLESLLDDFKLFLGLPLDTAMELDQQELEKLSGDEAPLPDEEHCVAAAYAHRLDYMTTLDQVDDRTRQVYVAADALRAGLDVGAAVSATSKEGRPLAFDAQSFNWALTAKLDLPIDRIRERNDYRESLIRLVASKRSAEQEADTIRSDLRANLREAEARQETLTIQQNSVTLAERRVENTRINLEAGRAVTRDSLDAQQSLVRAQNAATAARLDYHLARLDLFQNIEALRVDERGLRIVTEDEQPAPEPQP
jgi:outer membrane protein TolC